MSTDNHLPTTSEIQESGFDRVKKMYSRDIYGLLSPEMHYLVQSVSTSVIISATAGAFISMMRTKENYFRQNTASVFESQFLAKRKLVDTMALQGFRGAGYFALKYGSFSSLYLLSTMTIANYNNKVTVWDHVGTGALLGAIFRLNYGLKGMCAAAGCGGFLGFFAGGILVLHMWYTETTFDDLRRFHNETYYTMKKRGPGNNLS